MVCTPPGVQCLFSYISLHYTRYPLSIHFIILNLIHQVLIYSAIQPLYIEIQGYPVKIRPVTTVRNFIGLFLALIFRSLFQLIKKTKINHKSVIRVIKVFFFVGNIQSLNLNLIYQVFIYSSSTALHRYSVVGDNINTIKTTFYLSFDC